MITEKQVIKLLLKGVISDHLKIIYVMDKLNIFGKMGKNMKDNGEMGLSMEVEFGNLVKEIAILANGSLGKLKVMEFI